MIIVARTDPKITKQFVFLRLYSYLTVAKYDEKVVIGDGSLVSDFQLIKTPVGYAYNDSVFVWYHFGVEWTLRISSHQPSCFSFDHQNDILNFIDVFMDVDFV